MAFLNFSKIVLKSKYSYNFKTIFLTVLFWFDLVTLTFHENSNHGQENYWKSGVRIPAVEGQTFLSFFLFIFKFFIKNCISLFLTIFWYLVLLFRNQIKHVENVCFYWYLICKTRYSKMIKKPRRDISHCLKMIYYVT